MPKGDYAPGRDIGGVYMVKRLRRVGNSNALIIDKAVMELVGLEDDGEVEIAVKNGSIILTPLRPTPSPPRR